MTVKETLDAIEETNDIIEQTLDIMEQRKDVRVLVAGAAMGGLVLGFVVGYKLAQSRLDKKYAERSNQEIAEAREIFSRLHKKEQYATPEEAVATLHPSPQVEQAADALLKYQGQETPEEESGMPEGDGVPEVTVEVKTNIFTREERTPEEDYEEEKKNRVPGQPYIISHEEFLEAEPGYPQSRLTYYAGDDTLADERDEVVPLVDEVVGEINMDKFGLGSGDHDTLYIRNEKMGLDFEVSRSDGKYAHVVLGFQHSDEHDRRDRRNSPLKFRGGDE